MIFAGIFFFDRMPSLSNMTCKEFWEQSRTLNDKDQKKFLSDVVNLYSSELKKFKQHNNNISLKKLEELEGSPYVVMTVYQACEMRRENNQRTVGENIQKMLLWMITNENQKNMAKANGCNLFGVKPIEEDPFGDRGFLYACVTDSSNKSNLIQTRGVDNKVKSIKHCIYPKGEEICQVIELVKDNFCLSQFGICSKNNNDNNCSWKHTELSKKCLDN